VAVVVWPWAARHVTEKIASASNRAMQLFCKIIFIWGNSLFFVGLMVESDERTAPIQTAQNVLRPACADILLLNIINEKAENGPHSRL
jgi:hypothetical protein